MSCGFVNIIYPSTLKLLHLEFIDHITGNTFTGMQSIHSKSRNFLEDGVNNIGTPTTHLLQGVPTYGTIAIIWSGNPKILLTHLHRGYFRFH
jgi:hypothetical protein